jgi:hypothetical protein
VLCTASSSSVKKNRSEKEKRAAALKERKRKSSRNVCRRARRAQHIEEVSLNPRLTDFQDILLL